MTLDQHLDVLRSVLPICYFSELKVGDAYVIIAGRNVASLDILRRTEPWDGSESSPSPNSIRVRDLELTHTHDSAYVLRVNLP